MELSAFLVALKACFTEREVDRLSARAIRLGLSDTSVMAAADERLRTLLTFDKDDMCAQGGCDDYTLSSQCNFALYASPESVSQFDY